VFRIPEEKWHKDCIHGVTKGAGIKLMVWAWIWGRNKGSLIPIFEKSVDRFVYTGVLEAGLVDVWQEVEDTVGDPIFQQDHQQKYYLVFCTFCASDAPDAGTQIGNQDATTLSHNAPDAT